MASRYQNNGYSKLQRNQKEDTEAHEFRPTGADAGSSGSSPSVNGSNTNPTSFFSSWLPQVFASTALLSSMLVISLLVGAITLGYVLSLGQAMLQEAHHLRIIGEELYGIKSDINETSIACGCACNNTSNMTGLSPEDIYDQCYYAMHDVLVFGDVSIPSTPVPCIPESVDCNPVECTPTQCISVPCIQVPCGMDNSSAVYQAIKDAVSQYVPTISQNVSQVVTNATLSQLTLTLTALTQVLEKSCNSTSLSSTSQNQLISAFNSTVKSLVYSLNQSIIIQQQQQQSSCCEAINKTGTYLANMNCVVIPGEPGGDFYGYTCEISYSSTYPNGSNLLAKINDTINSLQWGIGSPGNNRSDCCPKPCDPASLEECDITCSYAIPSQSFDEDAGPPGAPISAFASGFTSLINLWGTDTSLHTLTVVCDFQDPVCWNYLNISHPFVLEFLADNDPGGNFRYVFRPLRMNDFLSERPLEMAHVIPPSIESLIMSTGARCAFRYGVLQKFFDSFISLGSILFTEMTNGTARPTINQGFWYMERVRAMVSNNQDYSACVADYTYSQQVHTDTIQTSLYNGITLSSSCRWGIFVDDYAFCDSFYAPQYPAITGLMRWILEDLDLSSYHYLKPSATCLLPSNL